jgi:hypothetical protein
MPSLRLTVRRDHLPVCYAQDVLCRPCYVKLFALGQCHECKREIVGDKEEGHGGAHIKGRSGILWHARCFACSGTCKPEAIADMVACATPLFKQDHLLLPSGLPSCVPCSDSVSATDPPHHAKAPPQRFSRPSLHLRSLPSPLVPAAPAISTSTNIGPPNAKHHVLSVDRPKLETPPMQPCRTLPVAIQRNHPVIPTNNLYGTDRDIVKARHAKALAVANLKTIAEGSSIVQAVIPSVPSVASLRSCSHPTTTSYPQPGSSCPTCGQTVPAQSTRPSTITSRLHPTKAVTRTAIHPVPSPLTAPVRALPLRAATRQPESAVSREITTPCPACGVKIASMELGTVSSPSGTRWHRRCLQCGVGATSRPGCGKHLDSSILRNDSADILCRDCSVSGWEPTSIVLLR